MSTDQQGKNKDGRDAQGRFTKDTPNTFKPGQSGNPKGRPKSVTLSEALRLELAKAHPQGDGEQTYAEAIAAILCQTAAQGNILAAKEIADRTEGKPKQVLDVDLTVMDWRELAHAHGLNEQDVINEARRLIAESALDSGGA